MTSFVTNAIAKRLAVFIKNLQKDSISMAFLRGESQLYDLQINEDVMQEILGMPQLEVKSARCNAISVRIPWKRIKTDPVVVLIDELVIQVEEPETLRPVPKVIPVRERLEDEKKGLADKILDGIRVEIRHVDLTVRFRHVLAPVFHVSLSGIEMFSTDAEWKETDLRATRKANKGLTELLLHKVILCKKMRASVVPLDDSIKTLILTDSLPVCFRLKRKIRAFGLELLAQRLELLVSEACNIVCDQFQWMQLATLYNAVQACLARMLTRAQIEEYYSGAPGPSSKKPPAAPPKRKGEKMSQRAEEPKDSTPPEPSGPELDKDRLKRMKKREKIEEKLRSKQRKTSSDVSEMEADNTSEVDPPKRTFWKRFKTLVQKKSGTESHEVSDLDQSSVMDDDEDDGMSAAGSSIRESPSIDNSLFETSSMTGSTSSSHESQSRPHHARYKSSSTFSIPQEEELLSPTELKDLEDFETHNAPVTEFSEAEDLDTSSFLLRVDRVSVEIQRQIFGVFVTFARSIVETVECSISGSPRVRYLVDSKSLIHEQVVLVKARVIDIFEQNFGEGKHPLYTHLLSSDASFAGAAENTVQFRFTKQRIWQDVEQQPALLLPLRPMISYLRKGPTRVRKSLDVSCNPLQVVLDREFIERLNEFFSQGLKTTIRKKVENQIEKLVEDCLYERMQVRVDVNGASLLLPPYAGYAGSSELSAYVSRVHVPRASIISDPDPSKGVGFGSSICSTSKLSETDFPSVARDMSVHFDEFHPNRIQPDQMQLLHMQLKDVSLELKSHPQAPVSHVVVEQFSCVADLGFYQWYGQMVPAPQLEIALETGAIKASVSRTELEYFRHVLPYRLSVRHTPARGGASRRSAGITSLQDPKSMPAAADERTPPIPVLFVAKVRRGALELMSNVETGEVLAAMSFGNMDFGFESHTYEHIVKLSVDAVSVQSPRHIESPFYVLLASSGTYDRVIALRHCYPSQYALSDASVQDRLARKEEDPLQSPPSASSKVATQNSSSFQFKGLDDLELRSLTTCNCRGLRAGYVEDTFRDILDFISIVLFSGASTESAVDTGSTPSPASAHPRLRANSAILSTYRAHRANIKAKQQVLVDFVQKIRILDSEVFVVESVDSPECVPLELADLSIDRRKARATGTTCIVVSGSSLRLCTLLWNGSTLNKEYLSSPIALQVRYIKTPTSLSLAFSVPSVDMSINRHQFALLLRVVESYLRARSEGRGRSVGALAADSAGSSFTTKQPRLHVDGHVDRVDVILKERRGESSKWDDFVQMRITGFSVARDPTLNTTDEVSLVCRVNDLRASDLMYSQRAFPVRAVLARLVPGLSGYETIPTHGLSKQVNQDWSAFNFRPNYTGSTRRYDMEDLFNDPLADREPSSASAQAVRDAIRLTLTPSTEDVFGVRRLVKRWIVETTPLRIVYVPELIRSLRKFFKVSKDTVILRSRYDAMKKNLQHLFAQGLIASGAANPKLPHLTFQPRVRFGVAEDTVPSVDENASLPKVAGYAQRTKNVFRFSSEDSLLLVPEEGSSADDPNIMLLMEIGYKHAFVSNDTSTSNSSADASRRVYRTDMIIRDLEIFTETVHVPSKQSLQRFTTLSPLCADGYLLRRKASSGQSGFRQFHVDIDQVRAAVSVNSYFTLLGILQNVSSRLLYESRAFMSSHEGGRSSVPRPSKTSSSLSSNDSTSKTDNGVSVNVHFCDIVLLSDYYAELELFFLHSKDVLIHGLLYSDVVVWTIDARTELLVNDVSFDVPEPFVDPCQIHLEYRQGRNPKDLEVEFTCLNKLDMHISRDMLQHLWTAVELFQLAGKARRLVSDSGLPSKDVEIRRSIMSRQHFQYILRNETEGTVKVHQVGVDRGSTVAQSVGPGCEESFMFSNPFLAKVVDITVSGREHERLTQYGSRTERVTDQEAAWRCMYAVACNSSRLPFPVMFVNAQHSQVHRTIYVSLETAGLQRIITVRASHFIVNQTEEVLHFHCDTKSRVTRFAVVVGPGERVPIPYSELWEIADFVVNGSQPFRLRNSSSLCCATYSAFVTAREQGTLIRGLFMPDLEPLSHSSMNVIMTVSGTGDICFSPPVILKNYSMFAVEYFFPWLKRGGILRPQESKMIHYVQESVNLRLPGFEKWSRNLPLKQDAQMRARFVRKPSKTRPATTSMHAPLIASQYDDDVHSPLPIKNSVDFSVTVTATVSGKAHVMSINTMVLLRNATDSLLYVRQRGFTDGVVLKPHEIAPFSFASFGREQLQASLGSTNIWSHPFKVNLPQERVLELDMDEVRYLVGLTVSIQDRTSVVVSFVPWLRFVNLSARNLSLRLGHSRMLLQSQDYLDMVLSVPSIAVNEEVVLPSPQEFLELDESKATILDEKAKSTDARSAEKRTSVWSSDENHSLIIVVDGKPLRVRIKHHKGERFSLAKGGSGDTDDLDIVRNQTVSPARAVASEFRADRIISMIFEDTHEVAYMLENRTGHRVQVRQRGCDLSSSTLIEPHSRKPFFWREPALEQAAVFRLLSAEIPAADTDAGPNVSSRVLDALPLVDAVDSTHSPWSQPLSLDSFGVSRVRITGMESRPMALPVPRTSAATGASASVDDSPSMHRRQVSMGESSGSPYDDEVSLLHRSINDDAKIETSAEAADDAGFMSDYVIVPDAGWYGNGCPVVYSCVYAKGDSKMVILAEEPPRSLFTEDSGNILEEGVRIAAKTLLPEVVFHIMDEDKSRVIVSAICSGLQLHYSRSPPDEAVFVALQECRIESMIAEAEYEVILTQDNSRAVRGANMVEILAERVLYQGGLIFTKYMGIRCLPFHLRIDGAVVQRLDHYRSLAVLRNARQSKRLRGSPDVTPGVLSLSPPLMRLDLGEEARKLLAIPEQYRVKDLRHRAFSSLSDTNEPSPLAVSIGDIPAQEGPQGGDPFSPATHLLSPTSVVSATQGNGSSSSQSPGSSTAAPSQQQDIYLQTMEIFPSTVTLSIGENDRRLPPIHEPTTIDFRRFERSHLMHSSIEGIVQRITSAYVRESSTEILTILGSLDAFVSPLGLARRIAGGLRDFVMYPYEGLILDDTPGAFVVGLFKGSYALISSILSTLVVALAKIFALLSVLLAVLTFDDYYQTQKVARSRRQHPRNLFRGLLLGMQQLGFGLWDAIAGMIRLPYRYGPLHGSWRALVGLIVKPLDGVIDFLSKSFEGLHNTFEAAYQPEVWERRSELRIGDQLTASEFRRLDELVRRLDRDTSHSVTSPTASSAHEEERGLLDRQAFTSEGEEREVEEDSAEHVEAYTRVKYVTARGRLRDRIAVVTTKHLIIWDMQARHGSLEEAVVVPWASIRNFSTSQYDTHLTIEFISGSHSRTLQLILTNASDLLAKFHR